MTDTEWRPVPGAEGHYEVSSCGRVRSVTRTLQHPVSGTKTYAGEEKKQYISSAGYPTVGMSIGGRYRQRTVHSIVAEAFLGPRPEGLHVRHLDGDSLNCRAENLAYGTPSENNFDLVRHGTHHNAAKSRCPRRHPLRAPNLVPSDLRHGRRKCLACARAQSYIRSHPEVDLKEESDRRFDLIKKENA